MIMPKLMGRTDDAKSVKAKVDMAALDTALKLYKLDNGEYPTTEQGLRALIEPPDKEGGSDNWKKGGYLEKQSLPKDPWGRDFIYLSPGSHGDYDIISYGADGVPGGEDKNKDIKSWESE
jgi:general secretion pathway protein G